MTLREQEKAPRPLLLQLQWFIGLRWLAGGAVLIGAAVEHRWLHWFHHAGQIALVGLAIIAYNTILWAVLRREMAHTGRRSLPLLLAWLQLLLDFGCLTLLSLWTGGVSSPLLGFFIFHMVFASLLLPRKMAYAGAAAAMLMMAEGLWLTGRWPVLPQQAGILLGWVITILATVWLANRMTRSLRQHRRRLIIQNRRIRAMSQKLRDQQEGMIQQEKMAAAGRMAAGVAHEVANPLASMDGLLQLMERRPDKARPDAVGTLREQISRINQIVRRMTEFAHPGDGQWQVISLNDLVDKCLEMLRFDPRLKRVDLQRQFSPDSPRIRIIAESLHQVIINLVINALDAMEAVADPRLVIRTGHDGGHVQVEVIDNGHGIPPAARRRLFEPFFTTKPVGKGTGLGLSISYSLVQKLGGSIQVESREGQGARFTIHLPIEASATGQPASALDAHSTAV